MYDVKLIDKFLKTDEFNIFWEKLLTERFAFAIIYIYMYVHFEFKKKKITVVR